MSSKEKLDNSCPTPSGEVPRLLKAYGMLSDTIVKAVKDRFPIGEVVHWSRREHRQRGEVKEVLGFRVDNLRLRVLNTGTGRMVDLYLYEIEETQR